MSEPTLQIVPYDPRWVAAFEAEAVRIRAALGPVALRIDHHGSTSVPGLAAKPIIDVQVSVAQLEPLDVYRQPLESIGYTHVPHPDDSFCPFFHRPHDWPHTHHVHVVCAGGAEERRTLAFRDYLRKHPEVAREYERLKLQLAPRFSARAFASRQAYADAKTEFVERVVAEALARGYPGWQNEASIRRGVAAYLFRPCGDTFEVLLLRRATEPFRGEWFPVEGSPHPGEQLHETALREVGEETGLAPARFYYEAREPQLVPSIGYQVRMTVFVGFVPGDAVVTLNEEHSAYAWLRPAEALERVPLAAQRAALGRIVQGFLLQPPPEALRVF